MLLAKTNIMALQLWNSFYVGWKCGHPYIYLLNYKVSLYHILTSFQMTLNMKIRQFQKQTTWNEKIMACCNLAE
jgi:hypothetical protein